MNVLFEFATGVLRGVVKVALLALTVVFVLGVLCIGLALSLVAVIRFVLTGRKPAVFATFTQFNQAAQQFRPGNWPGGAARNAHDNGDVVDVQAHEVRTALRPLAPPESTER
jgi:hypothetical protein